MKRAGERGFILVAALWLLVAMGAVGMHGALQMQTERLATANALDEVRAREAAMAASEYARSRLTAALFEFEEELRAQVAAEGGRNQAQRLRRSVARPDPGIDPWRDPQGLVLGALALGEAGVTLELRDLGAAVNLNAADEEILRNFFSQGLELDYALADALTQAILDWRDEDDLPRVGGAERDAYLRAGRAILPANRPFSTVDELRHVLGMTPEILEAARPYLTVIPAGATINVNTAPLPVLRALPGVGIAGADEIMRLRESGFFATRSGELLAALPPSVAGSIEARGEAFNRAAGFATSMVEIDAVGRVEAGVLVRRVRTVVARTNEGALVLWRGVE